MIGISHPPECSKEWRMEERLAYINWLATLTLDRINRDDPNMPVVSKVHTFDVLRWMKWMASAPAYFLEEHREMIEKPYDATKDRHAFYMTIPRPRDD